MRPGRVFARREDVLVLSRLGATEWPEVAELRDHWSWRPEWTPDRPRLLWYLFFDDSPGLPEATAAYAQVLRSTGADVVPPGWLHLTVTDMGFPDELDEAAVAASTDAVREALTGEPALELRLGPVAMLPGAVVLTARPVERLRDLRGTVRRALTRVGITPPNDIDGKYWPHVSLCYVNARTDHQRLRDVVGSAERCLVEVRCDRVSQVLVTRTSGHYRWEVVDAAPLRS